VRETARSAARAAASSLLVLAVGVLLLLALPRLLDLHALINATIFASLAILALSLAFVWGFAGILSFGQAAFFGMGGYTYAVELSADEAIAAGATRVTFNQSVISYVENFLNFPVGTIVPLGFYDRDRSAWVPLDNGRVIRITDVSGNLANVDSVGAGSLPPLALSDAERQQLAALYQPGQTLWRAAITHFSPEDKNWPTVPASGAQAPGLPSPSSNNSKDKDCIEPGSVIQCQSQTLGEIVPITGTPFHLRYDSDRTAGRKATLDIPLSGSTLPSSLRRIDLAISVAGRQFGQSFPSAPDQRHSFTWDGVDVYGRRLQGAQVATVSVGYVYQAVYGSPAEAARSFAAPGVGVVFGTRSRAEATIAQETRSILGSLHAAVGGWSLSVHHAYDPIARLLHQGDGTRRNATSQLGTVITTAAGNGTSGFSGDGGPATQAAFGFVGGVAVAPDGSLHIADANNTRIRRVAPHGIITTVAGTGTFGFSGDGGPAAQAALANPSGVAVAPDGSLYIADTRNNRIRRVGPDGIITTVAGNGDPGSLPFVGDGRQATAAPVNSPSAVAVARDGSLYIADRGQARVRRVGPDGIITTFAGNGIANRADGDGGPAAQAALAGLSGVAFAPDGSLYIAANAAGGGVRRVAPALPGFGVNDLFIPSEDGNEIYRFDGDGRHLQTLNALTGGVRFQFTYDSDGRVVGVTDGDGNITTIERDTTGNPTAIAAPGGQRTALAVDANGFLSRIANPAGEAVQLSYTTDGLLTTKADAKGNVHRFAYDARGRLVRDEDPAGGVKTFSRIDTADGYTVTLTTALGRVSAFSVERLTTGAVRRTNSDLNGARTEVVSTPDGTQSVTYQDGVRITSTPGPDPRFGMQAPRLLSRVRTLPGGQTETATSERTVTLADRNNPLSLQTLLDTVTINDRTFTRRFDAATRTVTESTAEGRQTVSTLDAQGRVIRQELAPGIAPITVTYDSRGRLIEIRQGTQFWTLSYDERNRVIARTDAAGQRVSFSYDDNDRIIQKTLPSGAAYQFAYDANGNRTQVILPSGARHNLQYTPVDLDAGYTPPGNGSYLRTYNVDRQLARTTLPSGRAADRSYDAVGRVSGIADSEAVTGFEYFINDRTDRVARIRHTAAGVTQDLAYGYNGSLISGMDASGAAPAQVSYSHDNNFFLITMNVVSGTESVVTPVTRDRDGLVSGFGPFTLMRSGPGGALSQITDGTVNTTYGYDTLARLLTRTHQVAGQASYAMQLSYDNSGRMTSKVETVGSATRAYDYVYDLDGQLTEVRRDGVVVERYAYDLNGNRISRQLGSGPIEAASYDSQDRLSQRGAVAYQFNADGFLTQRGNDTFDYGTRGQLLRAIVGGQAISYGYDGLGRRVSRTDGSGTSQYLYGDPSSHLVTAVRSATGEFTILYYDTAGLLIALERGGARYYVATDQVGTPRVVSSGNGTIVKVLEYDSLGNLLADSNPAFDLPLGYAGGLADAATGLLHFGYRDYDPAAGRWTARDPVLFGGGQGNLYVYVGNNPVNNHDPSGLFCVGVSAYAVGGLGVQTCITGDGASVCGEVGIGVGVSVGVDNGGLEKTGTEIGAEASVDCGPAEIGAGASLDSSGCAKGKVTVRLGPITAESDKGGLDIDQKDAPGIPLKLGCHAEAKLAGKVCIQGKF